MLHLRRMGLLNTEMLTASGETLDSVLDAWQDSPRRESVRTRLLEAAKVDPDHVIMDADSARREGLASSVVFPVGNLAPQGSVIKATSIDASVVGQDNVYRHRGPARVFTSEREAVMAIKGRSGVPIKAGDVIVMIGVGPMGTGMEETYQVTSALKFIPWGKSVPVLTDARFSGVSTGACVGHIGPEALAGGPIGRLRDGDIIEIEIDRDALTGTINVVETVDGAAFVTRTPHPDLKVDPALPDDTRLWAALQRASGGTWAGCVYDVDRLIAVLEAGVEALGE
jgi:dihydroxyacid dehydratase/phosphogluconate dehydratase